jgi:hypothetical protein
MLMLAYLIGFRFPDWPTVTNVAAAGKISLKARAFSGMGRFQAVFVGRFNNRLLTFDHSKLWLPYDKSRLNWS